MVKKFKSGRKTVRFDRQYYQEYQSEINISSGGDYDIPLRLSTYNRGTFGDYSHYQMRASSSDTNTATVANNVATWSNYVPGTTDMFNVSNAAAGDAVITIEVREIGREDEVADSLDISVTCA